jgi:hypothetical protein
VHAARQPSCLAAYYRALLLLLPLPFELMYLQRQLLLLLLLLLCCCCLQEG